MISGGEQIRRLLVFYHALWEARKVVVDRAERTVNPEDLDWFERERFEATMDENRQMFRRLEEFRLQAAFNSEPVSVKCTSAKRSAALRLALGLFEGELSAERAVDQLCSESFPGDVSVSEGKTSGP